MLWSTMPMCERLKYCETNQGGTRKENLSLKAFSGWVLSGHHVSVNNQQFKEELKNLITKRESWFLPLGYDI